MVYPTDLTEPAGMVYSYFFYQESVVMTYVMLYCFPFYFITTLVLGNQGKEDNGKNVQYHF